MKESTDREKEKQHQVPAEQNRKTLQQLGKLLAKTNAERLRDILITDTVTEFLENTLGVNVAPFILYQGQPYVYPFEVSKYFTTKDVMQRDIRIEAPCIKTGAIKTVLFARSWIAMDELDEELRELLFAGKMTIGHIIRHRRSTIEYQNLGYKEVRSATLAAVFKTHGSVHLIRRSRIICHKKRPVILIHEFVPV
jgi:chorismate-pyruvate lyase